MRLVGKRLAFIGAGQMAEALIGGLLSAGVCRTDDIRATDPSPARRELMARRFGVQTSTDNAAIAGWADVLVLAVKPQVCDGVLGDLRPGLSGQLVVSIVAGRRLDWLKARVPAGVRLVRVMPNAPALVGAGMSALAPHASATAEDTRFAQRLCDAVGRSVVVDEGLLDAVTGLSGSGPAFVFVALEALADGGVKAGLPRDVAEQLAVGAARGAATMRLEPSGHLSGGDGIPDAARAGLQVLVDNGCARVAAEAVEAAARRSQELGG